MLDDKAALALIVDVFVVEIGKFDKGFVGFFKPIAHDAGVVVHLVDERQIVPFNGRNLTLAVLDMWAPLCREIVQSITSQNG